MAIFAKAHSNMMLPSGGTMMVKTMEASNHTRCDLSHACAGVGVVFAVAVLKRFLLCSALMLTVFMFGLGAAGLGCCGWSGGKTVRVAAVVLSLACCAASIFSKNTTKSPCGGS